MARSLLALFAMFVLPALALSHPVPRDNHDRYITIRLERGQSPDLLLFRIEYRLEVDEFTVVHEDMKPFRDEADPRNFINKPLDYYGQFAKIYGPIFADNLDVWFNGKPVLLRVKDRRVALHDEKGEPLGHLRCTFLLEGEARLLPAQENKLRVRETSYRDQEGEIHLTLVDNAGVKVARQTLPDLALNKLHPLSRPLDHDAKLRNLTVDFNVEQVASTQLQPETTIEPPAKTQATTEDHEGFLRLFRDLRQQGTGLALLLLFFAGLGAAHALTPGHGKTLVAAYLVGERGTVWHAVVLGVVTTLTHTGVVLLLAAMLFFTPETMAAGAKETLRTGLGLGMGLIVACLGLWLLLQRLAGRADHIHLHRGHHHHDHGHGHHHHPASDQSVSWWGIVVLGMTGGLVPCWDAIVILATVVGTSEFWFALPALLAFSAGLAGVLVAIGILVVKFRNLAGTRWGEGRLIRALPIVSALLITFMGVWLCYESIHHQ